MIKAVIDTNILWVSVSRRSSSHWLFEELIAGNFLLAVTTDILHEYEEIISQKMGTETAIAVMETLEYLSNVEHITRYYQWQLIVADPDDDKFVDCSVAANSTCLVTHDSHFSQLKQIDFPKVEVLNLAAFRELLAHHP